MTKQVTEISIRAYADSLKISDKTVRNAIAAGQLKKGVSYRIEIRKGIEVPVPVINKEIADQEWGILHKTDKVKPGQNKLKKAEKPASEPQEKYQKKSAESGAEHDDDGSEEEDTAEDELISSLRITKTMSLAEATRRREIIAAASDKIKLKELEGSLVKKSDVDKALFAKGVELKNDLLNIPARAIHNIRSAADDVEAINILTIEIETVLTKFVDGIS